MQSKGGSKFVSFAFIFLLNFSLGNLKQTEEVSAVDEKNVEANMIENKKERSFEYNRGTREFMMNGEPFRIASGSFHYFRALPKTWRRKLKAMKSAGLNTVMTSIDWSLHKPTEDIINFSGPADLVQFIKIAAEENLFVIIGIGPYIDANRDLGGIPFWILSKYPKIQLRSSDLDFLLEIRKWFNVVMPMLVPLLHGYGGPIIMLQVEHEFGAMLRKDDKYISFLTKYLAKTVQNNALLFTADQPATLINGALKFNKDVLAAINFASNQPVHVVNFFWNVLRQFRFSDPSFNAKYTIGSASYWQETSGDIAKDVIENSFDKMLQDKSHVNFDMFYGGTNFGFSAGASLDSKDRYKSQVQSYNFHAAMDECGDVTEKYSIISKLLQKYKKQPNIPLPENVKKTKLNDLKLNSICSIFDSHCLKTLSSYEVQSEDPQTFEELKQFGGFVLYETTLPLTRKDPTKLGVEKIADRGYVYLNQSLIGILSRENEIKSMSLPLGMGENLKIIVENQGRVSNPLINDFKGLIGKVKYDDEILENWKMYGLPFDNFVKIESVIKMVPVNNNLKVENGPILLQGEILLPEADLFDTYFDSTGWGKGIIYVNGFHLGRYWPLAGPQITIHIPKELLIAGVNKIVLLEFESIPDDKIIRFLDHPILDGKK